MTYPTEEQEALIRNHRINPNSDRMLNPDNWLVHEETRTKLIILHKRTKRRRVIKKEI